MAFKLPKLTTDIDCGPIGYPGLVVRCWLNVTYDDWEPPEKPEKWDTLYYYGLGRLLETVLIPGEYTESGEAETVELPGGKAVYDLEHTRGFDAVILTWAVEQLGRERQARYRAELKN